MSSKESKKNIRNVSKYLKKAKYSKVVVTTTSPTTLSEAEKSKSFAVIKCNNLIETEEYFNKLNKVLKDPRNIAGFYHYLMNIDLTGWDPTKIPK